MKQSQRQFVEWLKNNDPAMFLVIKKRLEMGNGLGTTQPTSPSIWQNITGTIRDIAPTLLQLPFQKKVMDTQLKRAEQGLPPLDMADYSPTIKVGTTIDTETEAALTRIAQQTTASGLEQTFKKAAPFLGGGLLLWALMGGKKKR